MKNNGYINKRLIVSIIIVLIVVLIISVVLLIYLRNTSNVDTEEYSESDNDSIVDYYGKGKNNGISRESYFDINSCMRQYLNALNINNSSYYGYDSNDNYTLIVTEDEIKQKIYDLLSKKYIEENNITISNLYDYVKTVDKSSLFVPLEVSMVQDQQIKSFLVHGLVESLTDFQLLDEIFVIVNIDANNELFSIEPIYGDYNSISEINITSFENSIEENNNSFSKTSTTYEDIARDYIDLYKRLALGSPEIMYDLLDKEYREAKFGSVDEFKKYIEDNRTEIIGIRLEKYRTNQTDEYTQYICIDQNGNYYIFRETAILDYTVILDTYTIDLPEFTDEYNSSSDSEKVLLNIQKVFEAINNGDYNYVYNKLDSTFKQNNFPTLESFETYIKQNLYENNSIGYSNYQTNGNLHIYEISITNADDENSQTITKNFIMQLLDGTNFVMSFSV